MRRAFLFFVLICVVSLESSQVPLGLQENKLKIWFFFEYVETELQPKILLWNPRDETANITLKCFQPTPEASHLHSSLKPCQGDAIVSGTFELASYAYLIIDKPEFPHPYTEFFRDKWSIGILELSPPEINEVRQKTEALAQESNDTGFYTLQTADSWTMGPLVWQQSRLWVKGGESVSARLLIFAPQKSFPNDKAKIITFPFKKPSFYGLVLESVHSDEVEVLLRPGEYSLTVPWKDENTPDVYVVDCVFRTGPVEHLTLKHADVTLDYHGNIENVGFQTIVIPEE